MTWRGSAPNSIQSSRTLDRLDESPLLAAHQSRDFKIFITSQVVQIQRERKREREREREREKQREPEVANWKYMCAFPAEPSRLGYYYMGLTEQQFKTCEIWWKSPNFLVGLDECPTES